MILTNFLFKGFFDKKWHKKIKDKIDGIRNKRVFWNLINRKDVDLTVLTVFKSYVASINRELTVGDLMTEEESDHYHLSKKVIKKNTFGGKNIQILNSEIDKRNKSIKKLLEKHNFKISVVEFNKKFDEYKKEYFLGDYEQYDRLMSYFLGLIKNEKYAIQTWEKRKTFEDKIHDFEYQSGEKKKSILSSY